MRANSQEQPDQVGGMLPRWCRARCDGPLAGRYEIIAIDTPDQVGDVLRRRSLAGYLQTMLGWWKDPM